MSQSRTDTRFRLRELLSNNLEFHGETSNHGTHDFHAFPAKFPPQLPRTFIERLTSLGDTVLDPMMGSGTSIVEAQELGRIGIGFDIDPLAVRLCCAKSTHVDAALARKLGQDVCENAHGRLSKSAGSMKIEMTSRFDAKTLKFIDYWFGRETQLELMALILEIEKVRQPSIREFLELVFSAIIITKSGGVSLAWDLAHTRPHRTRQGQLKSFLPAISEFRKRLIKNATSLSSLALVAGKAVVGFGNAESLPLADSTADLYFTSPPYASNAIDYMRAHKFSLVWFGHGIDDLSDLRSRYIGGEKINGFAFEDLPPVSRGIVTGIQERDRKRGASLYRYYSEMKRVLTEAHRVLKPGKAAVFVVGSSVIRGTDSQTQDCLGEIGQVCGLDLVGIATRRLDRDKRMMPARFQREEASQIEQRMHEEYVVGFVKPIRNGG